MSHLVTKGCGVSFLDAWHDPPDPAIQTPLVLQGSWTPLHADVLRSYSWSANVAGAKRWLLLPPAHTHLLYDRFGRQMAPSFDLAPGSGVYPVPLPVLHM